MVSLPRESKVYAKGFIVLAKLTSRNRLTLPKAILAQVPAADYFEVEVESGRIVLTPLRISRINRVREKLTELGITEVDVADAVQWARKPE
jgi:hypothetical protein